MKTWFTLTLFLPFFISTAQIISEPETGGEYGVQSISYCITETEYSLLEERCNENAALFIGNISSPRNASSVSLNWPLKSATGFSDCSYYFISAHVDQDTSSTTFKDYNCGSIAYNGHRGTDIAIGPFPFLKMDNSSVEVIAAAAGTIIDKHDGEFDRNCVSIGSNLPANYVIVQHSDGSRAMYWHMKSGSITSKSIGQTVASGEYLGVVGSSGSSSGPHLHFEVWAGSTVSTLIDPFSGTCNHMNGSSWWAAQKDYTEPSILKASVHTTDITFPACGITETTNESTTYQIPFQGAGLAPGYAKFYIFMRNETSGTVVNMSILNPNSTVFNSWSHNCTSTYKFSYWGASKLLPTTAGTYTFQATYNGVTCSQPFEIITASGIPEIKNTFAAKIFPNPNNGKFIVELSADEVSIPTSVEIYNSLGEAIHKSELHEVRSEIHLTASKGIYFYRVKTAIGILSSGKLQLQ